MDEEEVILVNELDEELGTMAKLEAHEKACLHRAFSVFIMNAKGETMLQQRASHNTTRHCFGQIPVAVIKGLGRRISRLEKGGFKKKWALKPN